MEGPAAEGFPPAELSIAAQTGSDARAAVVGKDIGGACTFHAIVADAGSRARVAGNGLVVVGARRPGIPAIQFPPLPVI